MSENCATKACGAVPVEDLTIADMQKAIEDRFAPVTHCEVDDLGTCGTSYKVIIVSVSLFPKVLLTIKCQLETSSAIAALT